MLSKTFNKAKLLTFIGMFCATGLEAQDMSSCDDCPPFPECFTTGFFVECDYLYWRPEVNGLEYAFSRDPLTQSTNDQYQVNYDWESGFQVAIGYLFRNRWDFITRYTRLIAHEIDSVFSTNPGPIQDLFSTLVHQNVSAIRDATSNSRLSYNVVDAEAISHLISGNRFELAAMLGIRGAWITQDWKTDYSPTGADVTSAQNKWRVRGGGIRFGFEGNLDLGCGFTLTGGSDFSGILADQETTFRTRSLKPGGSSIFLTDINFSRGKFFPVVESSVGLGWGAYFRRGVFKSQRDTWGLHIAARWDFINWWNINDIQHLDDTSGFDDTAPGDLGLQGLTLRVTIVF